MDLIDRQAAIDAIHEDADWLAAQGSDWQVERMERDKSILKSLPTVQPNQNADPGKMVEDCISRQAAIDALMVAINDVGILDGDDIRAVFDNLPSAQPKRGKWIDAVIPNDNGDLLVQVCDQCNTFFPLAYTGGGHHFCPNYGADMRGRRMSGGITVKELKHIPGKNDAEYIKLLEEHSERWKQIATDAVAKIKKLSAQLSEQQKPATVTIGRTRGKTTMWYECDACGEPVDLNDNYCRNCGRKLIHV